MSDEYTITIRGPIPIDLADRISDVHAIAVVSAAWNEEIFPSRRALELKIAGHSDRAIARMLDVDVSTAHRDVKNLLEFAKKSILRKRRT
jgi:hypothetical protein